MQEKGLTAASIRIGQALWLAAGLAALASCGYSLKRSPNPLFEKNSIRKVFVRPVINDSYKPGVENLVYSHVVRVVSAEGALRVVAAEEDADAVLVGRVGDAGYSPAGTTTTDKLFPSGKIAGLKGNSETVVATEYSARLAFAFELRRLDRAPGTSTRETLLWSSGFSRSKPFPATHQLGPFGTTGALIADSEFDRAIQDLAQLMSSDMQESLMAQF